VADIPWRCGDANIQLNDVSLGRMIGHGIGPVGLLRIFHLQIPHIELVPLIAVLLFHIDICFEVHLNPRHIDLDIPSRLKVQVLTFGKSHNKLLDKRRHIIIGDHFALPFLNLQHLIGYPDLYIFPYLHLATEPPVVLLLLACKKARFSWQDRATTLQIPGRCTCRMFRRHRTQKGEIHHYWKVYLEWCYPD
jgi:hypothetical protein